MHQRNPAQIRRRRESRHVAHHPAAHRHHQRAPIRPRAHQRPRDLFHAGQSFPGFRIMKQMHRRRAQQAKSPRHQLSHRAPSLRRRHHMHAGKFPQPRDLPRRPSQHARPAHHLVFPRRGWHPYAMNFHCWRLLAIAGEPLQCNTRPPHLAYGLHTVHAIACAFASPSRIQRHGSKSPISFVLPWVPRAAERS